MATQASDTPAQGAFTLRMDHELIAQLDRERKGFAAREGLDVSRSEFMVRLIRRALSGAVDLPEQTMDRLDALRGSKSRVDFVGDLVTTCWDSMHGGAQPDVRPSSDNGTSRKERAR